MDLFDFYKKDIKNVVKLSFKDEVRLSISMKNGNNSARCEMIKANLPLVIFIANKYKTRINSVHELASEGNVGLIKAVDAFDHTLGIRFGTYAFKYITGVILKFKKKTEFSGSENNARLYFKYTRKNNSHYSEFGVSMNMNDMSNYLEISPDKLKLVISDGKRTITSMNDKYGNDVDELNLEEIIPDENILSSEDFILSRSSQLSIKNLIERSNLDDREKYIIHSHFGIDSSITMMFSELSVSLGVSSSRIAQLYERAFRKVKFRAIKDKISMDNVLLS